MKQFSKNGRLGILAALLMVLVNFGAMAQVKYGDNKAAGHYLKTRGIKLYYETYGQGEPLVLLHINGGSMKLFANQIPYFSKKYKVIAVDSRAHGRSTDTRDSLSFEQMADDINALLDSMHIKKSNIIGWSDGGITGLVMALRHPDKVKKLVVSGPNVYPDTTGIVSSVYDLMKRSADSLKRLPATADNKNQLKVVNLDLFQPTFKLSALRNIKCPTLVIGGDHDGIPLQHLLDIYNQIPKAYLWIAPNTSHFVAVHRKNEFNNFIMEFFNKPYHKIQGSTEILQ